MYKKLISSILVVALLNLLGCYSADLVTVTEYNQIEEEDKPDNIRVKTKDSQEYHFAESNFYIENDTLYGKVSVKELSFEGKFAFGEIESIQLEYFDQNYPTTISQYQKIEAESGKPDDIYLTKYDSTSYYFVKPNYYIENDTLYGKGKLILNHKAEQLNRKIPLSDIESIEFESINSSDTLLLSGGLLLALAAIFVVVFAVVIINWAGK